MPHAGDGPDAVVMRDVVLVGDEAEGDRGIVFVRDAGVAVDVREVFLLELGHQLLQHGVVLAKAFDLVAGALTREFVVGDDVAQFGRFVPCTELPVRMHV